MHKFQWLLLWAHVTANQPSGQPIDTRDGSISTAVYYGGKIRDGFNSACIPTGTSSTQSCIRIQEIDVNKQVMLLDSNIVSPGVDTYFPILRVTSDGKMLLAFGASSSSLEPSIFVTDANFNFASIAIGSASVRETSVPVRYGDYFGICLDPDGRSVWIAANMAITKMERGRLLYHEYLKITKLVIF